jgi:nucleoid DNA-binding protein
MPKAITDGVPKLVIRLHKKTGYHSEDIYKILNAITTEIRLMMEEGKTRRIYFEQLGSFDVVKSKPHRGYNIKTREIVVTPSMCVPKFRFNKTMRANIKKIKIDNG